MFCNQAHMYVRIICTYKRDLKLFSSSLFLIIRFLWGFLFHFVWGVLDWGLNSGIHTYKAGAFYLLMTIRVLRLFIKGKAVKAIRVLYNMYFRWTNNKHYPITDGKKNK
jgi:hypothetical protein